MAGKLDALGIPGTLDQVPLRICSEKQYRCDGFGGYQFSCIDAIHGWHFDVKNGDIRLQLLGYFKGLLAIAGFTDNNMPHVFKCSPQVHADDWLVICDHNTQGIH